MITLNLTKKQSIIDTIRALSPLARITEQGNELQIELPIRYIITRSHRHGGDTAVIHESFEQEAQNALTEYIYSVYGEGESVETRDGEHIEIVQPDDYSNTYYVDEFQRFPKK